MKNHNRWRFVFFAAALGAFGLFSCEDLSLHQEDLALKRPPLPRPASYIAAVPLLSDELVVATVPISKFTPVVNRTFSSNEDDGGAVDDGGGQVSENPPAQEQVTLVEEGEIVQQPVWNYQESMPLSSHPHLQLVRYWQRIGLAERYASATTTETERSTVHGTTSTQASSFSQTLGVSMTVSVDAPFASASASVSREFSEKEELSTTISSEYTVTAKYTVSVEQDENLVFAVWQLVEVYRFVGLVDGVWVPYADEKYEFDTPSLADMVVPRDEFRNVSYRFPAYER